jgi:hypothetical protein
MRRTGLIAVVCAALAVAGCASTGPAPVGRGVTAGAAATRAAGPSPRHPCGFGPAAGYRHVVWIWMENRSYSSVLGSTGGAPQLQHYANACGVATNYQAITHPSLPNYLAAVAGRTYGITTDCSPDTCSLRRPSLFQQVARAGHAWRGYAENMLEPCDQRSYDSYAARHNPAVYFPRIRHSCLRRDRAMGGAHGRFADALSSRSLPAFSFVTPNLCHDGHDCSTAVADDWLGSWLGRIVSSPQYAAGRTVVFVTWDEGVTDNHVATVVIGPSVPRGTRSSRRFTHYSLLRSTEQLLGLPTLHHAKTANSMLGAFHLR